MESPYSICLRFVQYYLQKVRATETLFLTGQEEMVVEALARLDKDLPQIKQAQTWLTAYAAEDEGLAHACLDYSRINNLLVTLFLNNQEQITWASTALEAARRLNAEAAIRTLLFRIGNLYADTGRYDQATPYLQELLELALAAQDKRDEGKARMSFGSIAYHQGRYAEAQREHESALALLKEVGDRSDVLGVLLLHLASVYSARGQHELSLASVQETITFLKEKKDLYHLGNALNNLGSEYHALGRYEEAFTALEEGVQIAKQLGDDDTLGYLLANLGLVRLSMREPDRARPYLEESVVTLQAQNNIYAVIAISAYLYLARMTIDNLDSAYQELCDLIAQASRQKMVGNILALLVALAKWYFLAGQPEQCLELLNFVSPRSELDSEWLLFISRLRGDLFVANPNLAARMLPDRSLNEILADYVAVPDQVDTL